jgi:hypothetical protein
MFSAFARKSSQQRRSAKLQPQLEWMEPRSLLSVYTPIPLGTAANLNIAAFNPTFPTGNLNFGGVPFVIPPTGNNVVADSQGPPQHSHQQLSRRGCECDPGSDAAEHGFRPTWAE